MTMVEKARAKAARAKAREQEEIESGERARREADVQERMDRERAAWLVKFAEEAGHDSHRFQNPLNDMVICTLVYFDSLPGQTKNERKSMEMTHPLVIRAAVDWLTKALNEKAAKAEAEGDVSELGFHANRRSSPAPKVTFSDRF